MRREGKIEIEHVHGCTWDQGRLFCCLLVIRYRFRRNIIGLIVLHLDLTSSLRFLAEVVAVARVAAEVARVAAAVEVAVPGVAWGVLVVSSTSTRIRSRCDPSMVDPAIVTSIEYRVLVTQ